MIDSLNANLRLVPPWLLYPLLAIPSLGWWVFAFLNRLGPDPVQVLEHEHGLFALQLLIVALCIRPLREQVGLNLMSFRRAIGLMAFYYALLHFLIWLGLDRQLDWPRILVDLVKRPYIVIGFAGFVLLIPLAITSNNLSVRRLGAAGWRNLHMLAYPATALAALHFLWLVKGWPLEPLVYLGIVIGLLLYRAIPRRRKANGFRAARAASGREKKLS